MRSRRHGVRPRHRQDARVGCKEPGRDPGRRRTGHGRPAHRGIPHGYRRDRCKAGVGNIDLRPDIGECRQEVLGVGAEGRRNVGRLRRSGRKSALPAHRRDGDRELECSWIADRQTTVVSGSHDHRHRAVRPGVLDRLTRSRIRRASREAQVDEDRSDPGRLGRSPSGSRSSTRRRCSCRRRDSFEAGPRAPGPASRRTRALAGDDAGDVRAVECAVVAEVRRLLTADGVHAAVNDEVRMLPIHSGVEDTDVTPAPVASGVSGWKCAGCRYSQGQGA